jgi:hypothetical protein
MTTNLTAAAQLAAARDHAAAIRAIFTHLTKDHGQDPGLVGQLTLPELENLHETADRDWTWGSNEPGFLPDGDTPNETLCWWDARDALAADLDHEARLVDDNPNGDINDSEALLGAAREVEEHPPGQGIEIVLKDSTGRDRAFWLQRNDAP